MFDSCRGELSGPEDLDEHRGVLPSSVQCARVLLSPMCCVDVIVELCAAKMDQYEGFSAIEEVGRLVCFNTLCVVHVMPHV